MARYPEAEVILSAAERWRDRCLIADGSVFTDEHLWTTPNLDQLDRYFTQNLDYGEGDFMGKLKLQLEPASPGAKKLAAEMFWVMYLMVHGGSMSAETKRYQIRDVWSWSGDELPSDLPELGEVLASGVARTGTAYNTYRWRELRFFIALMQAWKSLSRERRVELLSAQWAFASWLESQDFAKGRQLRHILLFLLFPDHFEPIATSSHKEKIAKEFRKEWGEDPAAVDYRDRVALDQEVLRVREVATEKYGGEPGDLHFYREPLSDVWRDQKPKPDPEPSGTTRWPDEEQSRRWLNERFGDSRVWLISPGEGARMWREFQDDGIAAIGWDYLGDLKEYHSRDEVAAAIAEKEDRENPTNDSLAAWQFANEMSEGDVILAKRGTRQILGWGRVTGDYTYEPERAEYQHVRAVEWESAEELDLRKDQRAAVKTLTEMTPYPQWLRVVFAGLLEGEALPGPEPSADGEYTKRHALEGLFLEPAQFTEILDALGRRKNVILQGPPGVGKTFMARRLAYALIGRKDPSHVQLVQFHQSYSYEDFIQGWRPNEQGGFVLRNGVFYEFCERAAADSEGRPYVFIIDEINRGNLSRIFGELMMLVESDKRGPEHAIPLTYSPAGAFSVPENLHLVGLMNTADRSLAMVDYALRRRFGFIDLQPAFHSERFRDHLLAETVPEATIERIKDRMGDLNDSIREDRRNLGPGFEIGHSYFVPSGNEEALDETWYESIVRTEIAPLLREYWFDQPDRVGEAVSRLLE